MHFNTRTYLFLTLSVFAMFCVFLVAVAFAIENFNSSTFGAATVYVVASIVLLGVCLYFFVKYSANQVVLLNDIFNTAQRLYRTSRSSKRITINHMSGWIQRETGGRIILVLKSSDGAEHAIYTITENSIVNNLEIPIDRQEALSIRDGLQAALAWRMNPSRSSVAA